MLFRDFRGTRLAISVLPSVVSDGSPGSWILLDPFVIFSCVLDRNLFAGGFESIELPFLWPAPVDSGAVDSPSSPEASREEGCNKSIVDDLFVDGIVAVLFRFPTLEPAEEGDDMVSFCRCWNEAGRIAR